MPPLSQSPVPQGPSLVPARRHKPSCKPGWPRILVTGGPGTYKSTLAAEFSADPRLGGMFWLEVGDGENTAEEYGATPGARYEIIEHDGTYAGIYDQLNAHWHEAKAAETAGALPIALTIDAMSGIHSMLQDMGDTRARRRLAYQLLGQHQNPADAWSSEREATITNDLWNLIKKRHARIMKLVHTWPGPVIMISRERVATIFENGEPTKQKDWSLECRKDLSHQATVWVRMHPGGKPPELLKLRSVQRRIAVVQGKPEPLTRFDPGHLVFDVIGCVSGVSRAPSYQELNADQDAVGDRPEADHYRDQVIAASADAERLKALYKEVMGRGLGAAVVDGRQQGSSVQLAALIVELGQAASKGTTRATPERGAPPAAVDTAAPVDTAADRGESEPVTGEQLAAIRNTLACQAVTDAERQNRVASYLLGLDSLPDTGLAGLTADQAETLALALARDDAAAEIAAALQGARSAA